MSTPYDLPSYFGESDSEIDTMFTELRDRPKILSLLTELGNSTIDYTSDDAFKVLTKARIAKPLRVHINDHNDANHQYDLLNSQVVIIIMRLCTYYRYSLSGLERFCPKPLATARTLRYAATEADADMLSTERLSPIQTQTQELKIMNTNTKAIDQVTRIYGVDADNVSDDSIVESINGLEAQIKSLNDMTTKPKAISNKIKALKVDVKDLVAFMDARTEADD